jgi:hypothetical protein
MTSARRLPVVPFVEHRAAAGELSQASRRPAVAAARRVLAAGLAAALFGAPGTLLGAPAPPAAASPAAAAQSAAATPATSPATPATTTTHPTAAPAVARPAFTPPADEALLIAAVDTARMAKTVRDLVAIGPRMGGTPSGDRAAAYLAAAFTAGGLTPQVVADPPRPVHWEDGWSVDLEPGGRLASAWPYGFSPSLAPVSAPLVALAAGKPLPKEAPPAWRGKIVFLPGELHGYTRFATSPNRPLAILTDSPGDGKRYLDAALIASLPTAPPGQAPRAVAAPLPVFGVSYADGQRLDKAAAAGAKVHLALTSTVRSGQPRTVIATVSGRDSAAYYLICAHGDSDSGGPGADDNGSGEAVVVELARVYAKLIHDHQLPQPAVSLRFAVWGSEYASSEAYIAREGALLTRCRGVINMDEVGTGAERNALYFESNEIPWNRALLRTFDRVGADYAGRPGFWAESTTNPSQGGTDSYAFLPRRYQGVGKVKIEIPATTVYTAAWDHLAHLRQTPGWESAALADPKNLAIDYSRYYHSSGDTPANTTDRKPQAMAWAGRAIGVALLRLTGHPPAAAQK